MTAISAAAQQTRFTTERYPMLLFIDGECSFCNRWAYQVRVADNGRRLRFGAKQGRTFQEVARVHPEIAQVESVVLLQRRADGTEHALVRSRAVRAVINGLPEFRLFATVLQIFPEFLSDLGYRIFSRLRTVLFGRWHHLRSPLENDPELYVD
jgi:predicted DCC family thiol-disulfide oxidoreductase YuxK